MQNIFAFCTICTKIYIKMICFLAVYLKIIIFAPTNMEQGRMILLRIAGRTTQGKAYFGKALSNLLSVKVIMSLIETCKAKYKFRLTLKVPHCFCCQQVTACRPHDADRKAAWGVLQAARHTAGSADDEGCNCRSRFTSKNIVYIGKEKRLKVMLESIKDDGTGGDSEKNNREYSGSFSRDGNGVNAVFPINIAK